MAFGTPAPLTAAFWKRPAARPPTRQGNPPSRPAKALATNGLLLEEVRGLLIDD